MMIMAIRNAVACTLRPDAAVAPGREADAQYANADRRRLRERYEGDLSGVLTSSSPAKATPPTS